MKSMKTIPLDIIKTNQVTPITLMGTIIIKNNYNNGNK